MFGNQAAQSPRVANIPMDVGNLTGPDVPNPAKELKLSSAGPASDALHSAGNSASRIPTESTRPQKNC